MNKEMIFTGISDTLSGRELHCNVDDSNRVRWWIVPKGEQGISMPFKDLQVAERFAERYARVMGFPTRKADKL